MIIRYVLLLCSVFLLASCETTEPGVKRNYISSYRGMTEDSSSGINKALVRKSDPAALRKYTKVMIEDVKVIPAKNLPENQKTATREEGERLADAFEASLKKEFSPHYEITNRRGRNTLLVRAALTDLQPSNPSVFLFNYLPYTGVLTTGVTLATGKTPGAGSTSMEAEVLDSLSRRQLYAIIDQHRGSKFQPGGIEKWGQTEGSMRAWSRKIRAGVQGSEVVEATPAARRYFRSANESKTIPSVKSARKSSPMPVAKTGTRAAANSATKAAAKTGTKAATKTAPKAEKEGKKVWVLKTV